jgi:hypothetical protein
MSGIWLAIYDISGVALKAQLCPFSLHFRFKIINPRCKPLLIRIIHKFNMNYH